MVCSSQDFGYIYLVSIYLKRRRAAQRYKGHVLCFSFHCLMRNDGSLAIRPNFGPLVHTTGAGSSVQFIYLTFCGADQTSAWLVGRTNQVESGLGSLDGPY